MDALIDMFGSKVKSEHKSCTWQLQPESFPSWFSGPECI